MAETIYRMKPRGDIPGLTEITGMSRASIYLYIKKGAFPAGIRLSKRSRGWPESQIKSWLNSRFNQPIKAFSEAMLADGLTPPDLIANNILCRFPGVNEGRKGRSGWCCLSCQLLEDDQPHYMYGDFKTGLVKTCYISEQGVSNDD